jgi:hypothetical protein
LEILRIDFERSRSAASRVRAATFNPGTTGGARYAVAIEDGSTLRLTLWVKRLKQECFIFQPRDLTGHVSHASYHRSGKY